MSLRSKQRKQRKLIERVLRMGRPIWKSDPRTLAPQPVTPYRPERTYPSISTLREEKAQRKAALSRNA